MSDWVPDPSSTQGLLNTGIIGGLPQSSTAPEVDLPKIGDTVRIAVSRWGNYEIYRGQVLSEGYRVIEAEVTAIKNVKVIFE